MFTIWMKTGTQNVLRPTKILAQKGRKSVFATKSGERSKTLFKCGWTNASTHNYIHISQKKYNAFIVQRWISLQEEFNLFWIMFGLR